MGMYVVGSKSFRPDQLFLGDRNKTTLLFFNISTLFNWYINLTIDGTIYPSQHFPFGAAFVYEAGNFWNLLRSFQNYTVFKYCPIDQRLVWDSGVPDPQTTLYPHISVPSTSSMTPWPRSLNTTIRRDACNCCQWTQGAFPGRLLQLWDPHT